MGKIKKEVLEDNLSKYKDDLIRNDLSQISIQKYTGDILRFLKYLDAHFINEINESVMEEYKLFLEGGCALISCNSYIISMNKYFKFLEMPYLTMKIYKVAPKQSLENVLTINEYKQLLDFTLNEKYDRNHAIMKTLGCTGIRISELKFITYEALLEKKVDVSSKNKARTVYLCEEICNELMKYCIKQDINSGIIFCNKHTNIPLESGRIWRELKQIARKTNVDEKKVYPHSFRHLFAKTYIEKFNAIDELADILGHNSIETTRIYTRTTGEEKRERLNLLGL